jgi:ribonuclease BN (tRNA processing enzyme)
VKLILLGTGSLPERTRCSAAHLLVLDNGDTVLFDAGEPVAATLNTLGVSPGSLKGVFISHMDIDHVCGLPSLLLNSRLWQKRGEAHRFGPDNTLRVWMPEEGVAPMRAFLPSVFLQPEQLPYRLELIALSEGAVYAADGLTVRAVRTTHRHPHQCYGFVIATASKRLAYTGDIGAATDVDAFLREPVDVLLVDATHGWQGDPARIGSQLRGKPVRRVVLTHIPTSHYGREAELARAVAAAAQLEVVAGADLQEVEV